MGKKMLKLTAAVCLALLTGTALADQCSVTQYLKSGSNMYVVNDFHAFPFGGTYSYCASIRSQLKAETCAVFPGKTILDGFIYVYDSGQYVSNWKTYICPTSSGILR